MKARIKKTGEIIEITRNKYGRYVDGDCIEYSLENLVFDNEENEHWQDVRERAAISALQGLLSNTCRAGSFKDYAVGAVACANALIEELKKE